MVVYHTAYQRQLLPHALRNSCLSGCTGLQTSGCSQSRLQDLFFPFGGGLQAIFRLWAKLDGFGAFSRSNRDTTWITTEKSLDSESVPEFYGLSTDSIDFKALGMSPWLTRRLVAEWSAIFTTHCCVLQFPFFLQILSHNFKCSYY